MLLPSFVKKKIRGASDKLKHNFPLSMELLCYTLFSQYESENYEKKMYPLKMTRNNNMFFYSFTD